MYLLIKYVDGSHGSHGTIYLFSRCLSTDLGMSSPSKAIGFFNILIICLTSL